MDLESLSSHIQNNTMRPSVPEWDNSDEVEEDESEEQARNPPGICVPAGLPQSEIRDIQRCFQRANFKVPGYLDASELKTYMKLRGCPITQWEAKKMVEYADTLYSYYINEEQVINLAKYLGIGTKKPLRLTRSEFEVAIQRTFRSSGDRSGGPSSSVYLPNNSASSRQLLNFDNVVRYFESKADDGNLEESVYNLMSETSMETILPRNSTPISLRSAATTKNVAIQTDYTPQEIFSHIIPKPQLLEPDDTDELIDEEPLEPVHAIKSKWEQRIGDLIANNADDFLVKLETERKSNPLLITKPSTLKNKKQSKPNSWKGKRGINFEKEIATKARNINELRQPSVLNHEGVQTIIRGQVGVQDNNITGYRARVYAPPPLPSPIPPKYPTEWRSGRSERLQWLL